MVSRISSRLGGNECFYRRIAASNFGILDIRSFHCPIQQTIKRALDFSASTEWNNSRYASANVTSRYPIAMALSVAFLFKCAGRELAGGGQRLFFFQDIGDVL